MRCTSGRGYLPGMRDRPCNQPLLALPFYGLKNRKKEHDIPVAVCVYCDVPDPKHGVKPFWETFQPKENP